ncbi:MAG TPA: HAMP domain-containing sensor histidine kinase [Xanthobacteraceae bacterium]|jgi:signal transduction histidine kinase
MPRLALVASTPACPPAAQLAHDLRNALAGIGLHLETLQRLSGPGGAKAADAAYALLTRCTSLCNIALDCADGAADTVRRRRVDLLQTARQVADLLAPGAPRGFCFDIDERAAGWVLADPNDVFRILFNLMNNAVTVATRNPRAMKSIAIRVGAAGKLVTAEISDNGPGLPPRIKSRLFRVESSQSNAARHGCGLAIARELAERNGGSLTLAPSAKGARFELTLASSWAPCATTHALASGG